jgi:hypothetical protein
MTLRTNHALFSPGVIVLPQELANAAPLGGADQLRALVEYRVCPANCRGDCMMHAQFEQVARIMCNMQPSIHLRE